MGDALRFHQGQSGLAHAHISTPQAEARIYLQGAHLTSWIPAGQRPVLFTSSRSFYRGGVPLVFPWFGPGRNKPGEGPGGPMHGYARIGEWTMQSHRLREDGAVELQLTLPPREATRQFGSGAFHLTFRLAIGAQLEMELEVRNTSAREVSFEEALHTYFAVGDIHRVSLSGLEGTTYLDKADGGLRKKQLAAPIRIAKEIDQVHVDTTAACSIEDPEWARRIVIEKSGSATTVVWNPWIEKTRTLADMAPGDWREMLCVETANAGENAIHIAPSASHRMRVNVRVQSVPRA